MIWTLGAVPVSLLVIGTPIFALLLTGAVLTFIFYLTVPSIALHQIMFGGLENYALLAIPFFIFAGELMGAAGIADKLIVWVLALIGRMPGSLGVATVGASTLIGAISGASVATVAAVGKSLYPGLIRDGYGPRFASGLVSSSGAIDILIPPSIAMILYGAAAEQSIPKLFVAGILPGMLLALMMAGFVVVRALQMNIPRSGRFNLREFLATTWGAAPALFMPVFVLASIYLGFASPTEAGGFACLYAMIVGLYVYRTMSWNDVLEAAARSAMLTAQILVIVCTAALFSWILTISGIPQGLTNWLQSLNLESWAFLMAINVGLLIVGCFLDPTSAILVLTPLLMPLVKTVGIDPIHFGIVMTANLAIGMFTPPFGLNIFVARSVLGVPLETIYRGVLPFAVVQITALLIITYWPELSLILTRAL
ncbi:TRAP transporter large permease [Pseudorhodoplanes sinuspersici]|uniref:TRAP transporter large permease protein n=1 Tax=Pseudorhodoplanes sinuspersici TaxID=1235591 RepID=A0A1W6ZYG1_9HYPH|nr:TRAP transporter large permease [Pseudorhodoplanes sinuspersici]ARQ02374.1 C4-dicarboxylate transporter [Pseudorhodoplanes sinuspersici]RKE74204.1 C4-dicarboxylate transporter DctM subunit [Pseudorhodoplanes sinuspersici]